MDNPKYYIDEYGLLIGLISTPGSISTDDFFQQEMKNHLSKIYKDKRKDIKAGDSHLYEFIGYKTFGNHDLAVMTLIDDFSYPNRVFNPSLGIAIKRISNISITIIRCLLVWIPYAGDIIPVLKTNPIK